MASTRACCSICIRLRGVKRDSKEKTKYSYQLPTPMGRRTAKRTSKVDTALFEREDNRNSPRRRVMTRDSKSGEVRRHRDVFYRTDHTQDDERSPHGPRLLRRHVRFTFPKNVLCRRSTSRRLISCDDKSEGYERANPSLQKSRPAASLTLFLPRLCIIRRILHTWENTFRNVRTSSGLFRFMDPPT